MAMTTVAKQIYDAYAPAISQFCDVYLNDAYKQLCLKLLEKLCRKRPSPLLTGNPNTWAAGIIHMICSNNNCFQRSSDGLRASDIGGAFGVSAATASQKAAAIRKLVHAKSRNEMIWDLSCDPEDDPWLVPLDDRFP